MKRVLLTVFCLCFALPLLAQDAANVSGNTVTEEKIDTPLEYYFGALALLAVVMTWAWVWLRLKDRPKLPPPVFDETDELAAEATDEAIEETAEDAETEKDS
ncbi:MAG: hypothetical protein KDB68_10145 [Planctomycetes bacterium]|nr:hypothetical protein [Planctomycetota bacterium]